jgi:hypothetical protein
MTVAHDEVPGDLLAGDLGRWQQASSRCVKGEGGGTYCGSGQVELGQLPLARQWRAHGLGGPVGRTVEVTALGCHEQGGTAGWDRSRGAGGDKCALEKLVRDGRVFKMGQGLQRQLTFNQTNSPTYRQTCKHAHYMHRLSAQTIGSGSALLAWNRSVPEHDSFTDDARSDGGT